MLTTGTAGAGIIQLFNAASLTAGGQVLNFPNTSLGGSIPAPLSLSAGSNTLTFTDKANAFQIDRAGPGFTPLYSPTGFPNGTTLLFAQGFNGSGAPIVISFSTPITEIGLNAEEFFFGNTSALER